MEPGDAMVKLALFGRPDPDLAELCRTHWRAMENNRHYPDPDPSQEELLRKLEEFEEDCREVRKAMSYLRDLVARKKHSRTRLEQTLEQRGNYVQLRSKGNLAAITSAALSVRKKRRPLAPLEPPAELQVQLTASPGVAIVSWSKVPNAKLYCLDYGPADGSAREQITRGKRRLELRDLQVGSVYSFRIASLGGPTGQSAWSTPLQRLIG